MKAAYERNRARSLLQLRLVDNYHQCARRLINGI